MQKKFLSGLLLFLFFNLLIKPFWLLGIEVSVQNRVGPEVYGLYFAIFSTTFLFSIFLDPGLTSFNNRNIARHAHLLSKQFPKILTIKLLLGGVYLVATLLLGLVLGYTSYQFYLLVVLCVNQFLSSFILYLRSNLSALLMFKADSILSVLDRFLMIIFCGILLWGNLFLTSFKIEWFIYSQTIAYLFTVVAALVLILRKTGKIKLTFDKLFSLLILKQCLPFAVLALLMVIYNRVDSVIMLQILGDKEGSYYSGIYASAYRLLDSVNMIAYLFSVILLPIFSKMLKEKENIQGITRMAFSILFMISVSSSITFSFQNTPIINALYDHDIDSSAAVFRILILGFIPISCTYIFGTLLTAGGSLKQLNRIAAMGVMVNILLDIVLIPEYKALGAAWTSLTTQSITALFQLGYALYHFKFSIKTRFIIQLLLFVLIIISANILLKWFSVEWYFVCLIMGCIAVISAFILNIVRYKYLKDMIHSFMIKQTKQD